MESLDELVKEVENLGQPTLARKIKEAVRDKCERLQGARDFVDATLYALMGTDLKFDPKIVEAFNKISAAKRKKTTIRNFERFKTRHEALLAYRELHPVPLWIPTDGILCAEVVSFDDWLWLPQTEENRYSHKEHDKWLR